MQSARRAVALMVQGTSSDAGKSLVAAALCRIYARYGLRVAPFKAQNMTSNGVLLPFGGMVSSAQVVQAIAAGVAPSVEMNPVLLRPVSHKGSEVFLLGESQGHMRVAEYIAYKKTAFASVEAAYAKLASQHDIVVIEGAGSPAEINLQQHDIVNMRMARLAKARVLLVGDIDRGGVFAHLFGTYQLLPPEDQALIAGFVLNKFRGDSSLLTPAFEDISARTGVPFLATIPHLSGLDIPEEDSLGHKGSITKDSPALQVEELAKRIGPSLDRLADEVEVSFGAETLRSLIA